MKLFLLIISVFQYVHNEQIWFVKFPYEHNYLSHIETRFPFVDLLEHDYLRSSYIFLVSRKDMRKFKDFIYQSNGYYHEIHYDSKNMRTKSQPRSKRWTPSKNPLDETYYRRYLSYDEQQDWFHLLANSTSTKRFVRLHNIGQTHEHRSLTVIQIHTKQTGSNKKRKQQKRAILIDGGMHAREWLSIGVANFIIIQFLKLRTKSRRIQRILNHFDVFVSPMVNPDGYEYSRNRDRLWRKNRSPTFMSEFWTGDDMCYGVDLNRNFPYQWNVTEGASNNPCAQAYRGSSPASEKEIQGLVHFLQTSQHNGTKFHVYFNLHTYGRFWLLPWTYSVSEKVKNYDDILKRSNDVILKTMNQTYKVGQASTLLYICSGTSIDFAATLMPHAITLELSPFYHGLPLCIEQIHAIDENCTIGFLTGPEAIEEDGTETFNAVVEYLDSIIRDHFV